MQSIYFIEFNVLLLFIIIIIKDIAIQGHIQIINKHKVTQTKQNTLIKIEFKGKQKQ